MAFDTPTPPDIELSELELPPTIRSVKDHDELLNYLRERLESGLSARENRITRYASIDKSISTWQLLSATDSQRAAKQEQTGEAQAIRMNLPLVQTHVDDMTSYFAGIYAPTNGEFFFSADAALLDQLQTLVDKLKEDAKISKYYKQVARAMRSLLKYNVGGLTVRWIHDEEDEDAIGFNASKRNQFKFVDMYNALWDPVISEPNEVATLGEWAATVEVKNRIWLLRREQANLISGAGAILKGGYNSTGTAQFYKHPPTQVGIDSDDAKRSTGVMNWDSFFPTLRSDNFATISGYEVVTMYCWIVPSQFDLTLSGATDSEDTLQLWRFLILDGKRIIQATPMDRTEMVAGAEENRENQQVIPIFLGRLNEDDLGDSSRSVAELLKPFQNFGSFLLNSHVDGVRSELFGITVFDPTVVDMSQVEAGSTNAKVPSKKPGADVRGAVQRLAGETSSRQPLQDLQTLMSIMREFFPSQALPNQVAGIDRAVQSQVAAVMQGSLRRLIMYMRVMDADMLGPTRKQAYRNVADYGELQLADVSEGDVNRLLGSGVEAANNEAAAASMQQLLFAMLQNPESSQLYDIPFIMRIWAHMQNLGIDLSGIQRAQPQQQQQQPGAAPGAEGEMPIAQ